MDKELLNMILDKHKLWLKGKKGGERADLSNTELKHADLSSARLSRAIMQEIDQFAAELTEANLESANLYGADLRCANLDGANLRNANLCYADLTGATLVDANLEYANLTNACLKDCFLNGANLIRTTLDEANLQGAWLYCANLFNASLHSTDFSDCNIDLSCLPLWCGSKGLIVDKRIAQQIAAHFCAIDCDDEEYQKARDAILEFAKGSHRARELGLLE